MTNLTGKKIKRIQCDNGGEYVNKRFHEFARECGIRIKPGPPHSPQMNVVVERYNKTLMNRARCLLIFQKVFGPKL